MSNVKHARKVKAAAALKILIAADDANDAGRTRQAIQDWLYFATAAEVRRAWRKSWGPLPGWAERPAVALGRLGRAAMTEAQAEASRRNGKQGGRPRKRRDGEDAKGGEA